MKVSFHAVWVSKAGNSYRDYEDAFYPKKISTHQSTILLFAIADGATEGFLSGRWAETLVQIFCRFKESQIVGRDFFETAYSIWNSFIKRYIEGRERRNKPIQWFEEPGLQAGAFASFLGLSVKVTKDGKGDWSAIAVGDSCLFWVRNGSLVTSFPVDNSSDFSNRPLLVSSNPDRNRTMLQRLKRYKGEWSRFDEFYLMTDALAQWFLKEHELKKQPWRVVAEKGKHNKSFRRWINILRETGEIRNDDVTLMCINLQ